MNNAILFDPAKHQDLLSSFVSVHIDCVLESQTIANFLPPFQPDDQRVSKFWQARFDDVTAGTRMIFMVLARKDEVAGYVVLYKPDAETGPFRAWVEKLLVSPKYRQRGIARAVIEKMEEVATSIGRTLLMLDTEMGSPAELVYPKLGYTLMGHIPGYEISPKDGSLKTGVFFYKDLRTTIMSS